MPIRGRWLHTTRPGLALCAGLLVFFVGLFEDVFRNISPRNRLLAALLSAALIIFQADLTVPGLGLSQTDVLFALPLVAVAVTLLWSAGSCHALNLIDGLNGLVAGYAIFATTAFSVLAGLTGDSDIQLVAGILTAAICGFLLLNWPWGRIFLGDAGAYAIGHVLVWLGILLLIRNSELSGFAVLLVLF
jgi:UDP-N-acetylmuramyl pentapeptide phosphotransferase/UDP-N-acetylglucosamine-1-phosphate transferase